MAKEGKIINHFKTLVAQKAAREGRKISYRLAESETGLSHGSMVDWMNGRVTQYHEAQIITLCRWLNCKIGDLLEIEEVEGLPQGEQ
jgi:DNA-binding Xre family transcriptional regulator